MATQTTITLTDDISGGKADETVTFGLDGHTYEIDLTKKNATGLRKALETYVEHGRRAARTPAAERSMPRRGRRTSAQGPNPAHVREWAGQNGIEISTRGRVATSVIDAYLEAHPS